MTTIAYRDGVMAADTKVIQANSTLAADVIKIVRRPSDGALCGGSGSIAWVQAFHRWFLEHESFEPHEQPVDPPRIQEGDRAIIARKGKPVEVFESCGSYDYDPDYVAIGSGMEFALGAMHHGATAGEAVGAAIRHDPGSGGGILVLEHDEPDLGSE
jgi:20S proteasome alpha/beta subunit